MKKSLMILASVALGASMAVGSTNVESKNIVGFGQATNVNAGSFWLVGCNFQTMTGQDTVAIADLFATNELYADAGGDANNSDQMMVFDGSVYTTYIYQRIVDPETEELGDPAWAKNGEPTTNRLGRGIGFWFKRSAFSTIKTLTVYGQAPMDASFIHSSVPVGFSIVANGYPNNTSISNLGIVAYADPAGDANKSDQLMVYDGSIYTTYIYQRIVDPETEELGDPAWAKDGAPTSVAIPVGRAAWYKRSAFAPGSASWTENKPY